MKKSVVISSLFVCTAVQAQQADETIRKGNDLYRQQQYEPARAAYEEALAKDPSSKAAKFNLASTQYRLSKPDEALKTFEQLAAYSNEAADKARAWYNKGAIPSAQNKLEESIEAYKNALRQNPNDKEARENLQKALLELKKRTPPPPKKEEKKKERQQEKKQQQPNMNQQEAEQRLKLLQQKEKELQEKIQKQKSKTGSGAPKDW